MGANLGEIVLRLLRQPALGAPSKNLGQTHGHFRRNPTLLIHQFRQRGARDSQRGSGVRNGQAERLNALPQYETARVRWILDGYSLTAINGNRDNWRPCRSGG
jgi:hypothetical protein